MSANLMVKTEAPRIRTVSDVLRTPDKRILLFADSGFTDLLMYSELESYRAVYSQIMRTGGEVRPADVFLEENMHRVLKQDAVFLQERLSLDDQVGRQCSRLVGHGFFYFSDESLATLMISWYARADLDPVLRDEFDTRLKWFVESGLLQRFRQEISPIGEECMLRMSDKADMQHRTLLFEDLRPLFLLFLLLLSPSTWSLYRKRYANTTLRISSSPWPPYSIYVKDEQGHDRLWGISGALLGNLTESMGMRIVSKIPADNQWGYRMQNGSWAGMLGDLSRNMWILMFLYMLLLAYLSLHLLSVAGTNQRDLGYLERFNRWNDMFFLYFSGLMQRATTHSKSCNKSVPFCGLLWLWLVCCFFVMNFFTANMSASLMVKTEAPRIRTVEDVLRTPNKRVLLFGDSGFTDLLMYSDLESYRALYSQITRTGGEIHPSYLFIEKNMREVLKQNSVILQEKLTLDDQVGRYCRRLVGQGYFYFSEQSLSTLPISWYARADLDPVIRDELYTRLMWYVDSGLLVKLRQETSPLGEECLLRMSDKSDLQHRTLLLDDLQPLFMLALLLLQFSTIVFLAELIIAAVYKRRQGPPRHYLFVDGRRLLQGRQSR
ncbi:hypothetical protein HPB50_018003 [Hyalomma asiaticum]|uniref:Uncharacterized protein n=1 Tax=Hyalomma asiaticum TaxID=266040 RepID=A0ACB7SMQ9_HYAAI|nr:hypothetical protein HPB50_018003 [Hyalomma asiaticum]